MPQIEGRDAPVLEVMPGRAELVLDLALDARYCFIGTPMTKAIFGEGMERARREIIAEHKLARYGQPEEIAAAAAFLFSADASFITGHALVVDGGYTAGRDHGVTQMPGLSADAP